MHSCRSQEDANFKPTRFATTVPTKTWKIASFAENMKQWTIRAIQIYTATFERKLFDILEEVDVQILQASQYFSVHAREKYLHAYTRSP